MFYLHKPSTKAKQVRRNNTDMVEKDLKQNFHTADLSPTKLVLVLTEAEVRRANQFYPASVFKIRKCKTNTIVSRNLERKKKKKKKGNFLLLLLTHGELQLQPASCTAAANVKEQTLNLLGHLPAPEFL